MRNILDVAIYESKTLFRSWFFRIFTLIAALFLLSINGGMFANPNARWTLRAIAANLPYLNVLFINVAQAVIAVFLASDFMRRDKKLDTTEVIYTRPVTNGQYVVGKTLGIVVMFVGLVFMALVTSMVFNLIRKDIPVVWEAYLYYPLLITLPTLVYILGLSFFLMILFRSQAVTFLILLAYIGLTLFYFQDKAGGLLDYMAFNLPLMYSDFIGFGDLKPILLQRTSYLLLGTGFIFATIRFLNRLPQTGRWNFVNLLAFVLFLAAGIYTGYLYHTGQVTDQKERGNYLHLNNRYAEKPVVDIVSNDLLVRQEQGALKIRSQFRFRNSNGEHLDTLVFSLNPGFEIDSITSGRGGVSFQRKRHLLLVVPEIPLAPGRQANLTIHYRGVPDETAAYLDVPRKQRARLKRIQIATVDKRYCLAQNSYVLLIPEVLWYPVAGVGFNKVDFQPAKLDFVRYRLTVVPLKGLLPVAPGEVAEEDDGFSFAPSRDLNALTLAIGPFEKKSITAGGVEYNLFFKPDHDYFSGFFTEITDTLGALISQAREDYEIEELDLYLEFDRVNLVEVPVQYHAFERPYNQMVDYIFPEMILLPEKGVGLQTLDFHRVRQAAERRNREQENSRTPREIETDLFKRFLQYTFFENGTTIRTRGRGGRGENLIVFDRGVNYTRNPYCAFPLYYSYVTGISSTEFPVFNSMMELYLKEGFEVSIRQGFEGGITNSEWANLALKERSMAEILSTWEMGLTSSLIRQTGGFIFSALKNRVGVAEFDNFLYYYLEDRAFSEITFERFSDDFYREFGVEIGPYMEVTEAGGAMASFMISEPEYIQTRDDIGDVYLVRFSITNRGSAKGMLDVSFRIMGQGGFGPGGMDTEQRLFEVDPGITKDVQVVFYEQPRIMTLNTLISDNIPSSYNQFLRRPVEQKQTDLTPYERISSRPVSYTYQGEFVVDNTDSGFSHTSVSKESKLKQYIDSRKEEEVDDHYGSLNNYWRMHEWYRVAHSAFYGETIRSAMATRGGDGSNVAQWRTVLPKTGFYDVYVYIPASAMMRRPDRSRQQGGQGQSGPSPSGQGNRRPGPRFADNGTEYHYTLSSNEGSEEVIYRLQDPEDGWNKLGSFHFPSDTATITLTNQTNGRRVIADAVKWVWKPS